MFEVGKLWDFHSDVVETDKIIDKLHSTQCFSQVNTEYVDTLKCHFHVFVDRIDTAVKGSDESYWNTLTNEPRTKLKNLWKVKKESGKGPKSDAQKREEHEKYLMQAMYYCLYVVLFWRHEGAQRRYKSCAKTLSEFRSAYEVDSSFPKDRMDKWETLFAFRNVMLLAAAVKPSMRNKGLFTKIGCILAEDRIHAMGGGQSFAADRRGYIYDKEGAAFALPVYPQEKDKEIEWSLKNLHQWTKTADCILGSCVGEKQKRRIIEGPPTLSRNPSLSQPTKQCKKGGIEASDDFPVELDLLLDDDSFTADLLRNMSLQNLVDLCATESVELEQPAIPINLHSAYVVGRAFSYNAYNYNSHGDTPLLGAPVEEAEIVDLSSSACSPDEETPMQRLSPTDYDQLDGEDITLIREHASSLSVWEI